jgi:hypothetical protein
MKTTALRLTELFVCVDDLCKKKNIEEKERRGRKSGLWVSEILTIQIWFNLSKCRDFKTFYRGVNGEFLRPFFPKMPNYSFPYETDKTTGKGVPFYWKNEAKQGNFLHRFDTPYSVQKCTPSKSQNIQKYGTLGPFVGLHNVWVKIASRPECIPKVCEIFPKARKFT